MADKSDLIEGSSHLHVDVLCESGLDESDDVLRSPPRLMTGALTEDPHGPEASRRTPQSLQAVMNRLSE
jgi:hypothetical protein